ncbi:hypothetical protein SAMN04488128_1124 [Chitinophaga eiseniae]|uniref:NUDIX domain-containing protein n=1 Tax=Chitinophaga eiseniae TaxID=634771 RepID=A0A1T4U793_9BACT|nr:NUDIX hydrolase [Chitinophaga eiseniae]SKA48381.1 hypothetical protein SAMN04488128_1124 [Chitinophaga eiseniae]
MKKLFFVVLYLLPVMLFAQSTPDKAVKADNYTILRLLMINQQEEILLVKYKTGWLTPSLRYNENQSIKGALDSLAREFGYEITVPQLRAMVTFQFDFKPVVSIRTHYAAHVSGGKLKSPKDVAEVKWVSRKEAETLMSLPGTEAVDAIRLTTMQILNHPETIWGGSFLVPETGTACRMPEPFYAVGRSK